MQYDGLRFRTECRLAGKPFGQPFGVDVVVGDPIFGEPDIVTVEDTLDFAGVAPPTLRLYPLATHIAEKLHAYTMPRSRPNSRVKDLPDIALLATAQSINGKDLRSAMEQTFAFRKTHELPASLPSPLPAWSKPYEALARDDALIWPSLESVTNAAKSFIGPVLSGNLDLTWTPTDWGWGLSQ